MAEDNTISSSLGIGGLFTPDENGEVDLSTSEVTYSSTDSTLSDWEAFETSEEKMNAIAENLYGGEPKVKPFPMKFTPDEVLGLPLKYNSLSDPNGRVYNETFMSDVSNVTFIPGRPVLNKKLIDAYGGKMSASGFARRLFANEDGDKINFGARLLANDDDLRFLGFANDYPTFYKYANVLCSGALSYMNIGEYDFRFKLSDYYNNNWEKYGITFFADKSTSISEDIDNQYGSSKIADMVGEKSRTAREAEMFIGKDAASNKITRMIESIKTLNPKQMVSSLFSYDSALTRMSNSLFRVVNGSQLMFPDIWQDSKFNRSYNLSFKFYSPYGHKYAIFKYVYIPFLSLLALACPCSDGIFGYSQPFLVRVECPGWFSIDNGVITGMTIRKGSSDNLWTSDSLPQMIEVDVTIQDLYSTLSIAKTNSMYKFNRSLSSYLCNLAGVRTDTMSFGKVSASIQRFMSNSLPFNHGFSNKIGSIYYDLQSKVNNIFK